MKFAQSSAVCWMAAVLCGSLYAEQVFAQAAIVPGAPPQATTQATPEADASGTLIVPAGTVVPLTLVSVIRSKSTPIGGTVRASVAFPVTSAGVTAIPEGAFVEGRLEQAAFPKGYKKPKHAPFVSPLKVHFTRLIYPNGYTVGLDADISAMLMPGKVGAAVGPELASMEMPRMTAGQHGPSADEAVGVMMMSLPPQQPSATQQPVDVTNPYAHSGPNPAVYYGPIIAAAVIGTLVYIGVHHHGEELDSALYGPGFQLSMVLTNPLALDRARVGVPGAQAGR